MKIAPTARRAVTTAFLMGFVAACAPTDSIEGGLQNEVASSSNQTNLRGHLETPRSYKANGGDALFEEPINVVNAIQGRNAPGCETKKKIGLFVDLDNTVTARQGRKSDTQAFKILALINEKPNRFAHIITARGLDLDLNHATEDFPLLSASSDYGIFSYIGVPATLFKPESWAAKAASQKKWLLADGFGQLNPSATPGTMESLKNYNFATKEALGVANKAAASADSFDKTLNVKHTAASVAVDTLGLGVGSYEYLRSKRDGLNQILDELKLEWEELASLFNNKLPTGMARLNVRDITSDDPPQRQLLFTVENANKREPAIRMIESLNRQEWTFVTLGNGEDDEEMHKQMGAGDMSIHVYEGDKKEDYESVATHWLKDIIRAYEVLDRISKLP